MSKSFLFVITSTSALVLRACGVEVIGECHSESAVIIIAVFRKVDTEAINIPTFLTGSQEVKRIEVYRKGFIEECLIKSDV